MSTEMLLHIAKPIFEGTWILIWTVWVAANTSKNWPKYKEMFKWQEPNKWPKLVKHTSLTYCEDCDPPPQSHDGEQMFCPKCDSIMAHQKHYDTKYVDANTKTEDIKVTNDWFCVHCNELWPDAAARMFQTNWHRGEARRQRVLRNQAAEQAEAAGFHQAGSAGWSSYKVHSGANRQFFTYAPYPAIYSADLIKGLGSVGGEGAALPYTLPAGDDTSNDPPSVGHGWISPNLK